MRCLFKKEGFINEKDEPQLEFIAESLQDSIKIKRKRLDAILKICTKARDVDPCEAAFNVSWLNFEENFMPTFF